MITKKVCVFGDFAVGKTSLTRRFVKNVFSEDYQTTVGVKIDTKEVSINDENIKLVIWDLAGEPKMELMTLNYLEMCQGLLLVVDGTRKTSFETAQRIFTEMPVPKPPTILLINKLDLIEEWQVTDEQIQIIAEKYDVVLKTSAKTGENVEAAFRTLTQTMMTL